MTTLKRRLIGVFAAVCLALTLIQAPALAADYSDMPQEGSWSYAALTAAVENGLLQSNDGLLRPDAALSRAEMATILVRTFGAQKEAELSFTDVPESAWYASNVAKAVQMGAFQGSGDLMRPNASISRQEAFTVLARVLCLEGGDVSVLAAFSDGDQVADWAVPSLAALVSGGYIQGSGGALNPQANIKRSEFAKVMYDLVKSYITEAGVYTTLPAGSAVIRTAGVTLQGLTVEGDLIVGDSVGSGGVTLDGVTVTGRVLIRGGSEEAVVMTGGSSAGSVVVWDGGSADEGGSTDEGGTVTEGETVTVTNAEEFTAALADPNCASITVSGWVEIHGGSYTINKPLTTGGSKNCLAFYNAQVTNESTITVLPYDDPKVEDSGLFVIYGDTMEGSEFYNRGTVNIQYYSYVNIQADRVENTGTIHNEGDLSLFGKEEVVNRGTINNLSGGGLYFLILNGPDGLVGGGDVINAEGGAFTSSGYFVMSRGNGRTFTNAGTMEISGQTTEVMCPMVNSGTLTLKSSLNIYSVEGSDGNKDGGSLTNSGTIILTGRDMDLAIGTDYDYQNEENGEWVHVSNAGTLTNSGTIQVTEDARLVVQGEGSRITNTGAIAVTGPGEIFVRANGTLDNQGEITVSGSDANFNIGMSWYDDARETQVNDVGVVTSSGAITVADSAWLCVQVEGSTLTNEAGGTITADSVGMAVIIGGSLDNAGTITLSNTSLDVGEDWTNEETGEEAHSVGALTNSGTVTIGADSGLGVHCAGSSLTNSGTITVQAGGGFGVDEGAAFAGNEVIDENA